MALLVITIFGLIIGSFLNVCIWRIPRDGSVIRPVRSYCPSCERQLESWENIPILSYAILRGKCRTCRTPISGRYPLVEALSAIAAVASYIHFGMTWTALVVYLFSATLIVITFIDFDFRIIPDVISLPGMIIGLGIAVTAQFTNVFSPPITSGVVDSLIGMAAGAGFFLVVLWVYFRMTNKVGIGLGDVKLMGFVGAVFGWQAIAPTIFGGSLLGSVYGIIVMLISRSGRHTEIAFGPWLALGTLIYIFTDIPLFRIFR